MPVAEEIVLLQGYLQTGGGEQLIVTEGYSAGVVIPPVSDGREEIVLLQGFAVHAPDALRQRPITQGYGGVLLVVPPPLTATDVQVLTVAWDVEVLAPDVDVEVL